MNDTTLEVIRDHLREYRDKKLRLLNIEEQAKQLRIEIYTMERSILVDEFYAAGIDQLGLPAEGNLPGYDATLKPFYHANIAANWPQEKKEQAYAWLSANGAADLIKSTITIRLPMGSNNLRKQIINFIGKLKGIEFTIESMVPWNSLTSFVKESINKRHVMPPLDVLGADVGHIVKLEERKDG
jgi:hypothetical protein